MTNKFEVGDYVYAGDFVFGYITDIEGDTACVEYDTGNGGGSLLFNLSELEHAEEPYDPRKHGAVVAIRIFMDEEKNISPLAELAFAYGGTAVIDWVNPVQREKYMSGINGYTLIYDERPKRAFSEWITREERKSVYRNE